jgi:uncharacterized protein YndB with AHSA1/START domain
MTEPTVDKSSIVFERVMPHSPEKIWRALTEPALMERWLMKNDFKPVVGQKFNFRADPKPYWNGITDCEVLAVEPYERLCYRWDSSDDDAGKGLRTVVTWTLVPVEGGTRVRLEQSGFRPADRFASEGAKGGWPRMIEAMEHVVAGLQ